MSEVNAFIRSCCIKGKRYLDEYEVENYTTGIKDYEINLLKDKIASLARDKIVTTRDESNVRLFGSLTLEGELFVFTRSELIQLKGLIKSEVLKDQQGVEKHGTIGTREGSSVSRDESHRSDNDGNTSEGIR